MNITEALPVGTVVKLKEVEKRVIIMGVLQQTREGDEIKVFDYIGVPYPEGYLNAQSTVLFQQTDIETVFCIGYSDIERQTFIAEMRERLSEEENSEKPESSENSENFDKNI